MPGTDGIEATRRLLAPGGPAGTRVLMLTTFDLDEYVFEALQRGRRRFPAQGRAAEARSSRGGFAPSRRGEALAVAVGSRGG